MNQIYQSIRPVALKHIAIGRTVMCRIRGMKYQPSKWYFGTVKGFQDNRAAIEDEGGGKYGITGLLVEIPELGINQSYFHWPVAMNDFKLV